MCCAVLYYYVLIMAFFRHLGKRSSRFAFSLTFHAFTLNADGAVQTVVNQPLTVTLRKSNSAEKSDDLHSRAVVGRLLPDGKAEFVWNDVAHVNVTLYASGKSAKFEAKSYTIKVRNRSDKSAGLNVKCEVDLAAHVNNSNFDQSAAAVVNERTWSLTDKSDVIRGYLRCGVSCRPLAEHEKEPPERVAPADTLSVPQYQQMPTTPTSSTVASPALAQSPLSTSQPPTPKSTSVAKPLHRSVDSLDALIANTIPIKANVEQADSFASSFDRPGRRRLKDDDDDDKLQDDDDDDFGFRKPKSSAAKSAPLRADDDDDEFAKPQARVSKAATTRAEPADDEFAKPRPATVTKKNDDDDDFGFRKPQARVAKASDDDDEDEFAKPRRTQAIPPADDDDDDDKKQDDDDDDFGFKKPTPRRRSDDSDNDDNDDDSDEFRKPSRRRPRTPEQQSQIKETPQRAIVTAPAAREPVQLQPHMRTASSIGCTLTSDAVARRIHSRIADTGTDHCHQH